jgi:hypothetical protein
MKDVRNPAGAKAISGAMGVSSWLYDIKDAIRWRNGFTLNVQSILRNDQELSRCRLSIVEYARKVRVVRGRDRLNMDRIQSYADDPEFERLKDVAGGVRILKADSFQAISLPPLSMY